jgi:hypothetical protein
MNNAIIQNFKSKSKTSTFLFVVLTLTFCLLTLNTVHAQTPTNYDVTVSPVFLDLNANPGDTLNAVVKVRNNTNSPIPLQLEVKRMEGDLNGNIALKQQTDYTTLSWFSFPNSNSVSLRPLEWTEIPFTVTVPKDAAYGYYFAVSFTQQGKGQLDRTGAVVKGAAAVPILLNVRRTGAKADAKIISFSIANYISEYLPADFKVKIQNTGNIHIKPHGNIFISAGNNKNIAIIDVNQTLGSVLPQSARIFESSWNDGFIVIEPVMQNNQLKLDKNGKPVTQLTFNWNKLTDFRFGKYTATLLMIFDNGTRDIPLQANISFWIVPYKALATMAITIIVFALFIKFLLGRYINNQIKKRLSTRT